jgi:hypothetical protein
MVVVESLCVVARGSEDQVERCNSYGCVVEFCRCVCLVVLTGPVDPALCCPASGIRPGLRFLDGSTHFVHYIYTGINMYNGDHCFSHNKIL